MQRTLRFIAEAVPEVLLQVVTQSLYKGEKYNELKNHNSTSIVKCNTTKNWYDDDADDDDDASSAPKAGPFALMPWTQDETGVVVFRCIPHRTMGKQLVQGENKMAW